MHTHTNTNTHTHKTHTNTHTHTHKHKHKHKHTQTHTKHTQTHTQTHTNTHTHKRAHKRAHTLENLMESLHGMANKRSVCLVRIRHLLLFHKSSTVKKPAFLMVAIFWLVKCIILFHLPACCTCLVSKVGSFMVGEVPNLSSCQLVAYASFQTLGQFSRDRPYQSC